MHFEGKPFLRSILTCLLAASVLTGCMGADKPFTLVHDNGGNSGGNPGNSATPPPSTQGCVVNFNGTMQLKVDSTNTVKLDAHPVTIDPIPIKVSGNNLEMDGDTFPDIKLTTLSPQADLIVNGKITGNKGTGTYDPATGKVEIDNFKFFITIVQKGTTSQLGTVDNFPPVKFTTDHIQATGNHNPIDETGAPLNKTDKSIKLVAGITIPTSVGLLSTPIGGGALSATLQGNLDQLPENCTAGGGGGGGGGGGSGGPSDFSISDGVNNGITSLDFGSTLVLTTNHGGHAALDCTDASNRGTVVKIITLTNTGTDARHLKIGEPVDTDGDTKDPLCSGNSEFMRGSVSVSGGATCESVTIAGKQFLTGDCTIPPGSAGKISFPLMYIPFNFTPATGGTPTATPAATPAAGGAGGDNGALVIQYDDGKSFSLNLTGKAEPDTRDSLSISKVKEGAPSKKLIRNKGLVKLSLQTSDPKPFTQPMVLNNTGGDSWQNVAVSIKDGPAFTVQAPAATTIGPGTADAPTHVGFGIIYNPTASGQVDKGTLVVTLNKAGSTAPTELDFDLEGTVGIAPILGNQELHIDFLTAFIDNALQTKPVESLDFRQFPDQAPTVQVINFGDVNAQELQPADIIPIDFDPLNSTVAQRRTALRLLNAQGSGLVPGQDSSLCSISKPNHEPDPINVPYQTGDCAYFYFNIGTESDSAGVYDSDTGSLTLQNLRLRIQNPYHGNVGGVWPPSNPNVAPPGDNRMDTTIDVSLTTLILDETKDGDLILVPDSRISRSDLNVSSKSSVLGSPCPADPALHPHLQCYLTPDGKNFEGKALTLRPGSDGVYDVVVVGVGQFQPRSSEADVPVFMDNSKIYIAIQGRLCKTGSSCH